MGTTSSEIQGLPNDVLIKTFTDTELSIIEKIKFLEVIPGRENERLRQSIQESINIEVDTLLNMVNGLIRIDIENDGFWFTVNRKGYWIPRNANTEFGFGEEPMPSNVAIITKEQLIQTLDIMYNNAKEIYALFRDDIADKPTPSLDEQRIRFRSVLRPLGALLVKLENLREKIGTQGGSIKTKRSKYKEMSLLDLKATAKQQGLKGYSAMNKADLVAALCKK